MFEREIIIKYIQNNKEEKEKQDTVSCITLECLQTDFETKKVAPQHVDTVKVDVDLDM